MHCNKLSFQKILDCYDSDVENNVVELYSHVAKYVHFRDNIRIMVLYLLIVLKYKIV